MLQNHNIKLDIISFNQNYYIRIIWFILIALLVLIDFILSKNGIAFKYFPWIVTPLIIALFIYNYAIKKYIIVGEMFLNMKYIILNLNSVEKRFELNNETIITFKYGDFKGEVIPLKGLLSGNEIFEGTNNFIFITTKIKNERFRVLINSKRQRNRLVEYLYLIKNDGVNVSIENKWI